MELTLPIFLKLFPGMLPTTFQTNKEKVEKAKKSFKAKLEMTKFLQETLDGMAPLTISSESSELAKDFTDFFQKIRTTGQIPSTQDILKYSRLFEDEITLDKLPRAQIIALCRYLNITAIGTTRFLRFQLKSKIRSIQIDDKIIQKEGLRTMKPGELKEACKVRGMRFYGISNERLKEQLQQWLELSVVKKIPPSLLLLSQAFALTNKLPNERALAATIQSLPSEVGTAHTVALSEREGQLDYETEIRMLKDELLKIAEENIETQSDLNRKMESFMLDAEKDTSEELSRYQALEEKMNEDISVNELATLEDALALNLYIEKDCLSELKTDLEQYQQRITELEDVMAKLKQSEMIIETIAAKRLHRKLLIIIKGLDDALEAIEHRETDTEERTRLNLRIKTPGTVKIDELMDMLRDKRLGDPLPLKAESQIAFILNKLDSDNDGFIKIRKLTKLLERLSSEESKVDLVSVTEYIKEIHNEEKLDNINKSENDNRRPS
ncbi:mitochondrial proton/calcium exchanger protein isoform X2 [Halyomorpha halys]